MRIKQSGYGFPIREYEEPDRIRKIILSRLRYLSKHLDCPVWGEANKKMLLALVRKADQTSRKIWLQWDVTYKHSSVFKSTDISFHYTYIQVGKDIDETITLHENERSIPWRGQLVQQHLQPAVKYLAQFYFSYMDNQEEKTKITERCKKLACIKLGIPPKQIATAILKNYPDSKEGEQEVIATVFCLDVYRDGAMEVETTITKEEYTSDLDDFIADCLHRQIANYFANITPLISKEMIEYVTHNRLRGYAEDIFNYYQYTQMPKQQWDCIREIEEIEEHLAHASHYVKSLKIGDSYRDNKDAIQHYCNHINSGLDSVLMYLESCT